MLSEQLVEPNSHTMTRRDAGAERGIMNPIRVYLDSSDYSNFARNANETTLNDTRDQLMKWKDDGLVEFRYSYAHIMEVAPTEPRHIDSARERMAQIESFCGRRCFVDPQGFSDLFPSS